MPEIADVRVNVSPFTPGQTTEFGSWSMFIIRFGVCCHERISQKTMLNATLKGSGRGLAILNRHLREVRCYRRD